MQSNKKVDMGKDNIIVVYMKGILSASVFSIFAFILMALMITYTSISEGVIPIVTSVVMVISVAMSGMYTGLKLRRKGWLNGAVAGLLYAMLMMVMGWIFLDEFAVGMLVLYKSLTGIAAGGIGGMIGVNLK
ncbi:TIGR04086 family membrane protein [Anaerosolibacter sp.]|uniref:TIGR04086 family membrane protein n=1 Tax=Anaerosolibacter sp. TaxID=1872527 RepID=UPI0026049A0F|nr:TIGR04086 family membrane protein [Anaerosolibacter sp.]MDF2546572.1 hypothetical protein [Anaerosolibacter sp.]